MSDEVSNKVPDDKSMAVLSHVLGLFTCILAPLIIWIINKDKPENAYVTYHAREALNFQITLVIAGIASSFLMIILIGAFMMLAIWIADLVLCIMAAMAANRGENYRYPFALRLVK